MQTALIATVSRAWVHGAGNFWRSVALQWVWSQWRFCLHYTTQIQSLFFTKVLIFHSMQNMKTSLDIVPSISLSRSFSVFWNSKHNIFLIFRDISQSHMQDLFLTQFYTSYLPGHRTAKISCHVYCLALRTLGSTLCPCTYSTFPYRGQLSPLWTCPAFFESTCFYEWCSLSTDE